MRVGVDESWTLGVGTLREVEGTAVDAVLQLVGFGLVRGVDRVRSRVRVFGPGVGMGDRGGATT